MSFNASDILASTGTDDISGSIASQTVPLMGTKSKKTTAAEGFLPWRRNRSSNNGTDII